MPAATRLADRALAMPFLGKYTGTTAAQNIHIGFKPSFIMAWNFTDNDTLYIWTKDQVAAVTVITTAVANQASAITQVDDGTTIGFALPGSDAVVNENAKVFYFIAFPE